MISRLRTTGFAIAAIRRISSTPGMGVDGFASDLTASSVSRGADPVAANEPGVAGVHLILAEVELRERNLAAAREFLLACLPVWERESPVDLMCTLTRLAACARLDGDRTEEARDQLARALALCEELESVGELPDIVVEIAALRVREDPERAGTLLGYAEQAWETTRHGGLRVVDPDELARELLALLGDDALAEALRSGRTLDFAGAVAEARRLVER